MYVWEERGKEEYYLNTESRKSMVLAYLVLNHFGEKANFKDPVGLAEIPELQLNTRMRPVAPLPKPP
jgi:hypothetical protein